MGKLKIGAFSIAWPQVATPEGEIFSGEAAKDIIDEWKEEQQVILKRQGDFITAAKKTETRLRTLVGEVEDTSKDIKKAKDSYLSVTTPVTKARWGRRLILATELHTYVRESHQLLNSSVERIKEAVEDGRLVIRLVENQIKDAQLYYEINGQIQLVGKSLAAARQTHAMPELQYQNLEISIEEVEKSLNDKSDEEIILEASKLLATPTSRG